MSGVLLAVTAFSALLIPLGCVHRAFALISLPGLIVFGVWFVAYTAQFPWYRERDRLQRIRDWAHGRFSELEDEWQRVVFGYEQDHADGARRVESLVAACLGLAAEYKSEVDRLARTAEADARGRHLRLYLIAGAEIPGIRAGRKQALAAHGIFTPADVDQDRVLRIKGLEVVVRQTL